MVWKAIRERKRHQNDKNELCIPVQLQRVAKARSINLWLNQKVILSKHCRHPMFRPIFGSNAIAKWLGDDREWRRPCAKWRSGARVGKQLRRDLECGYKISEATVYKKRSMYSESKQLWGPISTLDGSLCIWERLNSCLRVFVNINEWNRHNLLESFRDYIIRLRETIWNI
jgi:hypothetical protein